MDRAERWFYHGFNQSEKDEYWKDKILPLLKEYLSHPSLDGSMIRQELRKKLQEIVDKD